MSDPDTYREWLDLASKAASDHMPDNYGFILFAVPIGKTNMMRLATNLDRESVLALMNGWIESQKS